MSQQPKPATGEHHPSCTPNDRDLVWFCNQCGLKESAADIEQQLAAERKQVRILTSSLGQVHDKLAAERKKNDDWRNTERRVAKERDEARWQLAAEQGKVQTLVDALRECDPEAANRLAKVKE